MLAGFETYLVLQPSKDEVESVTSANDCTTTAPASAPALSRFAAIEKAA